MACNHERARGLTRSIKPRCLDKIEETADGPGDLWKADSHSLIVFEVTKVRVQRSLEICCGLFTSKTSTNLLNIISSLGLEGSPLSLNEHDAIL